jgi:hypothetical protein
MSNGSPIEFSVQVAALAERASQCAVMSIVDEW